MRSLFGVLLLTFASSVWAQIDIRRVWPEYRDAASFDRISEYFTKKENTGGQIVLRTQAGDRGGFYFLVRLKNRGTAIPNARIELNVIAPTSPLPKTHEFTTSLAAGTNVLNIGLTGDDWSSPKAHPVAWELRLLSSDGSEIGKKQSFLWSKPPSSSAAPANSPPPSQAK